MLRARFNISDNADYVYEFARVNSRGAPLEFDVGATLLMHVKIHANDGSPALEMSSTNGRAIIDPDERHRYTLSFPEGGLAAGNYVYDLLEVVGDTRTRVMVGTVTVEKGPTA